LTIISRDLAKRFNRDWIFTSFSYEFQPGNLYAVTGPNGSGKSTLLSVLSGMVPPSKGTVTYHDADGKVIAVEDIYQHLAIAAPYLELIEDFTVEEQIRFHFNLKPLRAGLRSKDLLERLYLADAKDKTIYNLSSGMKQRLRLGLCFWSDVRILLLDEPGTNLDSTAFEWYLNELSQLPNDSIVILASNNPAEYPSASAVLNMANLPGTKVLLQ
jgi:ABC-type multidrug transport system ATPase subunit